MYPGGTTDEGRSSYDTQEGVEHKDEVLRAGSNGVNNDSEGVSLSGITPSLISAPAPAPTPLNSAAPAPAPVCAPAPMPVPQPIAQPVQPPSQSLPPPSLYPSLAPPPYDPLAPSQQPTPLYGPQGAAAPSVVGYVPPPQPAPAPAPAPTTALPPASMGQVLCPFCHVCLHYPLGSDLLRCGACQQLCRAPSNYTFVCPCGTTLRAALAANTGAMCPMCGRIVYPSSLQSIAGSLTQAVNDTYRSFNSMISSRPAVYAPPAVVAAPTVVTPQYVPVTQQVVQPTSSYVSTPPLKQPSYVSAPPQQQAYEHQPVVNNVARAPIPLPTPPQHTPTPANPDATRPGAMVAAGSNFLGNSPTPAPSVARGDYSHMSGGDASKAASKPNMSAAPAPLPVPSSTPHIDEPYHALPASPSAPEADFEHDMNARLQQLEVKEAEEEQQRNRNKSLSKKKQGDQYEPLLD